MLSRLMIQLVAACICHGPGDGARGRGGEVIVQAPYYSTQQLLVAPIWSYHKRHCAVRDSNLVQIIPVAPGVTAISVQQTLWYLCEETSFHPTLIHKGHAVAPDYAFIY